MTRIRNRIRAEKFEERWLRMRAVKKMPLPPGGSLKGGMSEFGRRYKITTATLSYFLSGKRNQISFFTAVRLATFLNIDLSELQDEVRKSKDFHFVRITD